MCVIRIFIEPPEKNAGFPRFLFLNPYSGSASGIALHLNDRTDNYSDELLYLAQTQTDF